MATEVLLTGGHQHHVRENQIEARIKNGQKNVQGQAILREVSRFLIDTGNIANWNSLKSRKVTQSPASELYYSLLKTLQDWSQVDIPDSENNSDDCFVKNKNSESLENEERGLYKVTVKVFLHKFDARYIKEAIDNVLQELKIQYVDTVYLALPPIDDKTPFVETITPFWQELERLQEAGITTHISSCDLDANRLKMLLDVAKIRPEVNQVNLTSCCHMPEDLVAYAKHVNVLLHTHGDQPVMLSEDSLQELVHSVYPTMERKLSTNWVLRYAVVVKCRGVIMSKGYIASFE